MIRLRKLLTFDSVSFSANTSSMVSSQAMVPKIPA